MATDDQDDDLEVKLDAILDGVDEEGRDDRFLVRSAGALRGALGLDLLADPESWVGRTVGRVRIEAMLATGGMGAVYRGFDEGLRRPVAVKTIHGIRRLEPEARSRFLREARILSQLNHPAICQVYDLVEHGETDFLVLELVEGKTLRERSPETEEEILTLGAEVARALAAAHARQIVHRDLKPENVMLTEDRQVKVLDFGIARSLAGPEAPTDLDADENDADEESSRGDEADLTRRGAQIGTPAYMSPEQARGEPVDEASDLFSLGLILYELWCGRRAYPADTGFADLMLRASTGRTLPIEGPDAGRTRLLQSLLSPDPAARPSAAATVEALEDIRRAPERQRRRRGLAFAGAGLVAAVLTAWLLGRSLEPKPLLGPDQQGRVLLLPFDDQTGNRELARVLAALPEMLASSLDSAEGVQVVTGGEVVSEAGEAAVPDRSPDALRALAGSVGAELVVTVEVSGEPPELELDATTVNANGSVGHQRIVTADPLHGIQLLAVRLVHRMRPGAAFADLADRFSADPLANRLYAIGRATQMTRGPLLAIPYFEVAVDTDPGFGRAMLKLGECRFEVAEYEAAADLAEQARAMAAAERDPALAAEALELLSQLDLHAGRFDEAGALLEEAHRGLEGNEESNARHRLSMHLGDLLRTAAARADAAGAERLRARAAEALRGALEGFQASGDRHGEAVAWAALGAVYDESRDLPAAEDALLAALALTQEHHFRRTEARVLNSLAIVVGRQGRLDDEEALLRESLAVRRDLGDRRGVIAALNNLGAGQVARGAPAEAIPFFEQALAEADDLGFELGIGMTSFNLADAHLRAGSVDRAWPHWRRAREFYGDLWDMLYLAARIAQAEGDGAEASRWITASRDAAGSAWGAVEQQLFEEIQGAR